MVDLSLRSTQASPLSVAQVDNNFIALNTAIVALQDNPVASGTVTSVGLTVPSFLSRTGSPVTSSGTIVITLASQTTNKVFASPNGSTGTPDFRALVEADLPTISLSKLAATTASRAATFNASGVLTASSTITTTELDYLDGVTSNIQTQLDAKQATITVLSIANGGSNANTAQGARVNLLPSLTGNAGEFLRVNAGENDVEWAVPTSAIPTINSLSGALTIAVGVLTTGNDVNVSASGTTVTINIPPATATVQGKVSVSAQTFGGTKTFADGVVLPISDTYIAYSSSGSIVGSANYVANDTKEQLEIKRISVTERQVALGFNSTDHTTNYNIDATTDHIIYMDCVGGNLDATFFDTANPDAEIGSIYEIVKTTTTNNLTVKVQGSDSIGTLGVTSVTITGTKGWIRVQYCRSQFFKILGQGTIS